MVRLAEDRGPRSKVVSQRTEGGDPWTELLIPRDATVLGRHGGDDSFDIPRFQKAVIEAARNKSKIWFLFLNTREFSGATGLPNLRFLPATADPILKGSFQHVRCHVVWADVGRNPWAILS
jgi:hypothetical protein